MKFLIMRRVQIEIEHFDIFSEAVISVKTKTVLNVYLNNFFLIYMKVSRKTDTQH